VTYAKRYVDESAKDLRRLRNQSRAIYNQAEALILLACEHPGEIGYALVDEWEGARALHFWNDQYRLVWEEDDKDELVIVLRAAKRFHRGKSLYDLPRPD
jgi:mRNA-degrading endonuclease RelE of RelBE toxin-antitoxin system